MPDAALKHNSWRVSQDHHALGVATFWRCMTAAAMVDRGKARCRQRLRNAQRAAAHTAALTCSLALPRRNTEHQSP